MVGLPLGWAWRAAEEGGGWGGARGPDFSVYLAPFCRVCGLLINKDLLLSGSGKNLWKTQGGELLWSQGGSEAGDPHPGASVSRWQGYRQRRQNGEPRGPGAKFWILVLTPSCSALAAHSPPLHSPRTPSLLLYLIFLHSPAPESSGHLLAIRLLSRPPAPPVLSCWRPELLFAPLHAGERVAEFDGSRGGGAKRPDPR